MTASCLVLWAVSIVGIDVGWQPLDDGGLEYIIQIEPEMLDSLRDGLEIVSEVPPSLGPVRTYRIRVGKGQLPRQNAAIEPPRRPGSLEQDNAPTAPNVSSPQAKNNGDVTNAAEQRQLPDARDKGAGASSLVPAGGGQPSSAADAADDPSAPTVPSSTSLEPTEQPLERSTAETHDLEGPPKAVGSRSQPADTPDPFSNVPLGPRYADVAAAEPPMRESEPKSDQGLYSDDEPTASGPELGGMDRGLTSAHPQGESDASSSFLPAKESTAENTKADDTKNDLTPTARPALLPREKTAQPIEQVAAYQDAAEASTEGEASQEDHRRAGKEDVGHAAMPESVSGGSQNAATRPPTVWLALIVVLALSLGANVYLVLVAISQRRSYRRLAARERTSSVR